MINLTVVIDNDEALKKLKELQNVAKSTTSSVVKDSERMDASFQQMKNSLMSLTAGVSFAALAKQIVSIRGEVQQLEVAFETMLGSKQKADTLMTEIIDLAAKTPFGLQDVSNATKMLLAYGSTAEQVADEIKMLGNIASGLSIPLNDMIYLYGTTRTQGRMFTQDLRQFMGRGIPLAEELAKQFGVTKDKVGELVTAGKVGFDDMAKALKAMSSEGGKFYNLMDEQSQTISGQISNLEDSIYQMFNAIGEKGEGIIKGAIGTVSDLVENYERVGRILLGLVSIYGTYKAAIVAYTVVTAIAANAAKGMAVAEQMRIVATIAAEKAQKMLNATMLLNPYVLAAVAVAGLVALLISQKTATERLREAEENYNDAKQETIDKENEHKRIIEELTSIAGDEMAATDLRKDALHKLIKEYPEVFAKYRTEAEMLKNIRDIKLEIANIDAGKSITNPQNELADVNKKIAALEKLEGKRLTTSSLTTGAGISISALTRDQEAELQQLRNRRAELLKEIRDNQRDTYLKNAPSLTEKELDDEIAKLKRVQDLIRMRDAGFNTLGEMLKGIEYDKEIVGLGFGDYDEQDLAHELKILEAERNARDADKKSAKEWVETKKKAYEDAKKSYNDYVTNQKDNVSIEVFEKESKRLKENADMAKKEYDKYNTITDKANEKQEKKAKESKELIDKLGNDAVKARIDVMNDGLKKTLAQIDYSYNLEMQEIDKQEAKLKELRGGTLTEDDTRAIEEARTNAEDKRDKDIADVYRAEFAAMQDYLKEYGTFQQRKLAIAEEYAKKIANTDSAAQKQALEKQRDSIMAGLSAEKLNASINWELIFGDLGSMFKEYIRPEFEALKAYMETPEFKNAPASDKQAIVESYSRLESILGEGGVSFAKLGESFETLKKEQQNLTKAQKEYATSYNELIDAQNAYTQALEFGNAAAIESARIELEKAEEAESAARTNVNAAEDNVANAQNNAATTAHKLSKAFDDTIAGLASLKSATLSTLIPAITATAKGLKQFDGKLGDAAGEAFEKLSEKLGGLLQFVLSIIDVLKEGLSGLVVPILDAVFNAISGILGDILNFKDGFFRKLGESLLKGIISMLQSILSFGGLFDLKQYGPDNSKLERSMANLAEANAALQRAIEKLSEDMDYNEETYKKQMALLDKAISNTANVMYDAANNYDPGALGFIGGTKSTASYVDDKVSDSTWKEISELLGKEVASAWDFFSLSASDMLKVAEQLPAVYAEIKSYANDGAYDAAQYMDQYIDYARQIEELQREHTEFLTKTTYDEMKNAFKNALTDMEMSAEDFANSFNKMLVNSMADALIYQKYQGAINILLGKWADYMTIEKGEKAATLTDEELAHLQLMRDNLYKQLAEDREALDAAFGGDLSGQEAHSKGFQTMSQETGSELNGRFTDIQGQTHRIAEAVEFCRNLYAQNLTAVQSINSTVASIHNDTSLIEKHTRVLGKMGDDLAIIRRSIEGGAL